MKRAPFRVLFFLAALVALGVVAAAVTIPHLFRAGDPILADEVNENLSVLAAASDALSAKLDALSGTVEAGIGPLEVVVAGPALQVEDYGLPTTAVTTMEGRWQVSHTFEGYTLCPSDGDVRFFLMIDDVPVVSTVMYAASYDPVRARLSGPTERVLPAGEHELRVGTECVGPDTVATTVISSDDEYAIVVLPE